MEIQVQGNFTTVLEVVRQIVMTPFSEAATGAALQKSVLKNFAKFTRKHLCRCLLIEKETPTQVLFCFSVNLAKFLRTTCLQISSGRLPLHFIEWRKTCFSLRLERTKKIWYFYVPIRNVCTKFGSGIFWAKENQVQNL